MKVITVCGSLKFQNEIMEVAEKLNKTGVCVLTPVYPYSKELKLEIIKRYLKGESSVKLANSPAFCLFANSTSGFFVFLEDNSTNI